MDEENWLEIEAWRQALFRLEYRETCQLLAMPSD
jgi:hypothetical protein